MLELPAIRNGYFLKGQSKEVFHFFPGPTRPKDTPVPEPQAIAEVNAADAN
jgi:hypothetical protein